MVWKLMISSKDNQKIKFIKKVKKRKEKNFLFLEGERLVNDASLYLKPVEIFVREGIEYPDSTMISEKLFEEISDTENSQGIIGIFPKPESDMDNLFISEKVYYLDRIQDPGNLGTIIRSADAFGIDALVLRKGTCDPFSSKVIRATVGSLFRVPIYFDDRTEILDEWKKTGNIYATSLTNGKPLDEIVFQEPYMIVIGNEGAGVDEEILEKSDANFFIPMKGNAESLNAGVAASILMFAL